MQNDEILYDETKTRVRYEKLIQSLNNLIQAKTKDSALTLAIDEIGNFINAYGTSVWLLDSKNENRVILAKTYAENTERIKEGKSYYVKGKLDDGKYDGLTGYIFSTGNSLLIENITNKNEIKKISPHLKWSDKFKGWESGDKEEVRPFLGVPIFSFKEKKVIGVLRLATTRDRKPFTELDLRLSEIFARILSFKLIAVQQKDQELDLFISLFDYPIDEKGFPDENIILNKATKKFTSLFPGSHCTILFDDDGSGRFFLKSTSNEELMKRIASNELCNEYYVAGEGKTGAIIAEKKAKLFCGSIESPLVSGKEKESCEICEPATSFIGAPIFEVAANKLIGVIRSAKHSQNSENDFDEYDKELLDLFSRELSFFISFFRSLRKKDILGILIGFIDPKDVDSVIRQFEAPKTPSDALTIMFVDIKGFANFCNSILHNDPNKIITLLNVYFDEMGKYVLEFGGVINSIKGDEFLAVFNGFTKCENHKAKAIDCAFKICDEFYVSFQKELIKNLQDEFGLVYDNDLFDKCNFGIKIGIKTTSNVIIGSIGPKGSRTISITGQDLNLASRLITEVSDTDVFKNDTRLILCFDSTIDPIYFNKLSKQGIEKQEHAVGIRGGGDFVKYRINRLFRKSWEAETAECNSIQNEP